MQEIRMQENWKDITGYAQFYMISNTGKVFSKRQNKILKPQPNSNGYLRISLSDGKRKRKFFVHRLVAVHFVSNPDAASNNVVNHLDGNFRNNNSYNLEWTTMKGNSQHALKTGRMKRTKQWLDRLHASQLKSYRAVEAINPSTGKVVERFDAIQHVKEKGYDAPSVCMCCTGKRMTHKGLKWRYAGGD